MSEPSYQSGSEQASSGSTQGTHVECQPLSIWLQVCSGTMPNDTAMAHLQHAAQCRDCSMLLSEANACLDEDAKPEEELILRSLKTSSLAGQFELARRMSEESARGGESGKGLPARLSWLSGRFSIFAWSAAAACLVAVTIVLLFRQQPDNRLLAEAYNQQRPSELRLHGTDPGPVVSPTRGDAVAADSSELLRLKLRTQESFEKRPNDPKVRQMLGRIALVQHDGETARRNFEIAEALDPNLPGLTFDLAAAHFELGESTGHALEYGRAADLFSQYLQASHGKDPVAFFNRGLCWERQSIVTEATKDFQAALALEKDPKWRREIENHLATLKRSAEDQSSLSPRKESLTAATFLSVHKDSPGLFETFQGIAGREWLARRDADQQIGDALQKLSALGVAHDDKWLEDMLRVPVSKPERAADETLSDALSASANGNADRALSASSEAMRLYKLTGNQAGYLRAAVEHVYTLQRMGLNGECLQQATVLIGNTQLARYSWLRTYLQLEVGAAHAMLGDASQDRKISSIAAVTAANAGLPLSSLRATSFIVNDDVRLEHYQAAWDEATAGLRSSQVVAGSAMPRFQLLTGLISIAKALDLQWTRAGLAAAAATAARTTRNQQTAAYAMEELALDDLQTGDLIGSSQSFHVADELLASLGSGPAARRYAADWKTDRVLLTARELGPGVAVQSLAREESGYQTFDAALPRLHFYTEYADLLRQSHNTQASIREVLIAITDAEHRLGNFHTEADRQRWPKETRKAYEVLVSDLSENSDDPTLSLRAWEWLQSAPYREGHPFVGDISLEQLDHFLPPLPRQQEGHLTLIIARVLNGYIAWSLSTDQKNPVREKVLAATPNAVSHRGSAFVRLCADPHSSAEDIAILGQGLYNDLLRPFADQISRAEHLDVDVDGSLADIPFAALEDHGRYLGLEHPLNFLPNWWFERDRNAEGDRGADRFATQAGLVILKESQSGAKALIPEDYDESGGISRLFPHAQLRTAVLWRDGDELALSGSPDLKTILAHALVLHYVGHGLDEAPGPASGGEPDLVLKLSDSSLPHCRLVVLAACQTLREREESAEDVPSFARIVLAAGAGHVLATQWDVDSRMTRRLMLQFYAGLAEHKTFSEALHRAQQSLQSDPSASHPYFWSGFQLVGE
jgi:tetratricopeptide (TPR) repeat protein